jgi:hypothetical protein
LISVKPRNTSERPENPQRPDLTPQSVWNVPDLSAYG